ncbi:MAG: hypothetical protein QGH25_14035, partial [Candidatus Latescibacteria bacterium]|nr:hypothetical protein [Candidatus Latescibacterota bacterium]
QVADLAPLAGLAQLTSLDLTDNRISDIAPLAQLRRLRLLNLDNNLVSDIGALMGLRLLRDLELSGNPLVDLADVEALADRGVQVRYFVPYENPFDPVLEEEIRAALGDIKGPISQKALESITFLSITGPFLSLNGVERMRNLDTFFISYTGPANRFLGDLSPISQLVKLTNLSLRGTPITNIQALGNLVLLDELSLPSNRVADLRPLAALSRLEFLNLAGNDIIDLLPLVGLSRLATINLTNNLVTDLSPLLGMAGLKQVWVRGNPLSSATLSETVPALREKGVFVVGI